MGTELAVVRSLSSWPLWPGLDPSGPGVLPQGPLGREGRSQHASPCLRLSLLFFKDLPLSWLNAEMSGRVGGFVMMSSCPFTPTAQAQLAFLYVSLSKGRRKCWSHQALGSHSLSMTCSTSQGSEEGQAGIHLFIYVFYSGPGTGLRTGEKQGTRQTQTCLCGAGILVGERQTDKYADV